MATWTDLRGYVKLRYKVTELDDHTLQLLFHMPNERSQFVLIGHTTGPEGEDYATLTSPFSADLDLDWPHVLREMADHPIGGVVIVNDIAQVRHVVPLANLDLNEFEVPMQQIIEAADTLEHVFVSGDQF
jgi:hypothetical protein